jgi:hypothetical protein
MPRKLPKKYTYKEPQTKEQRAWRVKGGLAKSEKKARAARDNGLLGGYSKSITLKIVDGVLVRKT